MLTEWYRVEREGVTHFVLMKSSNPNAPDLIVGHENVPYLPRPNAEDVVGRGRLAQLIRKAGVRCDAPPQAAANDR